MRDRCSAVCVFILVWTVSFVSGGVKPDSSKITTREMNFISWMEFREFVPDRIETVLLPVGSLEAHGVIPNGTDNLAPEALCRATAERLNAMIAPTLNYGVTPSLKAYPGAISVSSESYLAFIKDILSGLAAHRFRNIIILNGHGGNTDLLKRAASEISGLRRVRILVVNWWSLTSEDTFAVFGENGGHAGNNETAYIQAVFPEHVHPERYRPDMAMPNPSGDSFYAVPAPASIGLYEEGQGYPTFDPGQAVRYFQNVNDRVAALIKEVIDRWDRSGLYSAE